MKKESCHIMHIHVLFLYHNALLTPNKITNGMESCLFSTIYKEASFLRPYLVA
jgi:hypothetical protein